MFTMSTGSNRPASSATAANACSGAAPRAPAWRLAATPPVPRPAGQVQPALGVRDRCRHQLGEGGQSRLGVGRQQLLAAERHDDAAPHPALSADRHADRGAQPPVAGGDLADHAGDVGCSRSGPGRSGTPPWSRSGRRAAAGRQLGSAAGRPFWSRCRRPRVCPAGRSGPGSRSRPPGAGRPPRRPHRTPAAAESPGHQRRHPPQRGLLLGQPRRIGWIGAHPPVGGTSAGT